MKQLIIIFFLAFIIVLAQQKLYKKENYKHFDVYNKVQKKVVRVYYDK